MLRATAAEAERILQDAVGKLDDPLHLRCTSSPDYLVSRAQAALDAVSALEKGHAQYLTSRAGECPGQCMGQGRGRRPWCPPAIATCGPPLQGATPWSPPTLQAWGPTDPGLVPALLLCSCVPWACPAPPCVLGAGLLGPWGSWAGRQHQASLRGSSVRVCRPPEQTPPASWRP